MLDQGNKFYFISLNILITHLLDNVLDIIGRNYILITSKEAKDWLTRLISKLL